MNSALDTPIRYFKGVGPKKSELLSKLGVGTALDMLYYLPSRYEDRSSFTNIRELKIGESQTIKGEITALSSRLTRSRAALFQATVTDGTGRINAVWFNQPYLRDYLRKGQTIVLYGRVDLHEKLQITQPDYEIVKEGETDSLNMGRIVPIYPLTSGVTNKYMRTLADFAIEQHSRCLVENLPTSLIARQKLVDIKFAVHNIHFPSSFDSLEKAYRRIVFDEFFMLQLALALKRRGMTASDAAFRHDGGGDLVEAFRKMIPFELTAGQKKAMADIERDMSSGRPMNRLLEGDVGSGKTLVAAYALTLTVQNGFQGAIMAPTEVLARQHFITLSELLMPLGINVSLLVSGMEDDARAKVYADIRSGAINVVIGTHAVIQEAVGFYKLGLAIIDEQHKFGVTQRSMLKKKGVSPHMLVMTATPIPRTLALTVYGDLDVSIIRELPKGRRPIETYWVEEEKRPAAYDFVKEELQKGRQAYIVCPLIEGAAELYDKLRSDQFADRKVALLHGKMDSNEKEKVMKDFKKGLIDVLVATVVIEVGIDVPNATVMLIENADRFGLSQLHQLRGRIGRGEHESFCILLANPKTESAVERIKAIEGTVDGFRIAEADLEQRGPGEFFGTRQHGLPEIRFGNILKDFDIMESARREAFALVESDPGLRDENHRRLKDLLRSRFKGRMELVKVS